MFYNKYIGNYNVPITMFEYIGNYNTIQLHDTSTNVISILNQRRRRWFNVGPMSTVFADLTWQSQCWSNSPLFNRASIPESTDAVFLLNEQSPNMKEVLLLLTLIKPPVNVKVNVRVSNRG